MQSSASNGHPLPNGRPAFEGKELSSAFRRWSLGELGEDDTSSPNRGKGAEHYSTFGVCPVMNSSCYRYLRLQSSCQPVMASVSEAFY